MLEKSICYIGSQCIESLARGSWKYYLWVCGNFYVCGWPPGKCHHILLLSEVSPLFCEMTLPCEPRGTQANYLSSALQRWLHCFFSLGFHRDGVFVSVIVGFFEARDLFKLKHLIFLRTLYMNTVFMLFLTLLSPSSSSCAPKLTSSLIIITTYVHSIYNTD